MGSHCNCIAMFLFYIFKEFEGSSLFKLTEIAVTVNIKNVYNCGVSLEKISVIVMRHAHRELIRKQFVAFGHDYKLRVSKKKCTSILNQKIYLHIF